MNRPNPAEEQEAARLEEFLNELRQNPTPNPGELDPSLAEITRLTAESEKTTAQAAKPYAEAAKGRVWQKALASLEYEKTATLEKQPAISGVLSVQRKSSNKANYEPKSTYILPEEPVRIGRKMNWPQIVLGGMAATIVIFLGLFGVSLLSPSTQNPTNITRSGSGQPTPNPVIHPTPTLIVQPTAIPTLAPTIKPSPTVLVPSLSTSSAPYLSATVTLTITAKGFTEEQAFATKKVLELRMFALGFSYAVATVNGGQITLEVKGNVLRDTVLQNVITSGRIEFVDVSGGKIFQQGETLQTTYCSTGSLLKPQSGLCIETAPDPRNTAQASGISTADDKPFQTILTGEDLIPESLSLKKGDTGYDALDYTFKPEAATIMKTYTETHIGQQMAITLNGKVLLSATVQGVISDKGELTTTGESLTSMLAYLKSGPLPLPLALVSMS